MSERGYAPDEPWAPAQREVVQRKRRRAQGAQVLLMQRREAQSRGKVHALPTSHALQVFLHSAGRGVSVHGPPQSFPVSLPSCTPFVQSGIPQTVASHERLVQSDAAWHFLPLAHGPHACPQSTSDSPGSRRPFLQSTGAHTFASH